MWMEGKASKERRQGCATRTTPSCNSEGDLAPTSFLVAATGRCRAVIGRQAGRQTGKQASKHGIFAKAALRPNQACCCTVRTHLARRAYACGLGVSHARNTLQLVRLCRRTFSNGAHLERNGACEAGARLLAHLTAPKQ
ncbi:hypothetical protein L1887_55085 [Cichorium endivia]|nr:hypothetical protein L1887_55085 [Cichorium endivia]